MICNARFRKTHSIFNNINKLACNGSSASDSANIAVRAFLTKAGEHYLGHSFNTGSGKGKSLWEEIKDVHFKSCCAYCGTLSDRLQIELVFMLNRTECEFTVN